MKGPIVSIDVSKGKSDYQAFKEMNVKYTGSRSIKHTKEGFDEIVSLVREMEKKLETEVCVVYEATGVYHRVLKKVLEDNNIKQFIINPYFVDIQIEMCGLLSFLIIGQLFIGICFWRYL